MLELEGDRWPLNIFQALVLGIVQGLAEFIPISSSAHLIIVPWLFGWPDYGLSFDVALHAGTLLALLVFFWRDWVRLIKAWWASIVERKVAGHTDRALAWIVIVATIPGGLAGVLFESRIEDVFHTASNQKLAMIIVAGLIVALALLLWLADRIAQQAQSMEGITLREGIIIGLAQMLAILPGVSRAGSTITAGLFTGLTREAAARFSFLLGTPIIAGAALKAAYDMLKQGLPGSESIAILVGFASAAIVGFLCIKFLLAYLQRGTMRPFVYYRFAIAAVIVGLVIFRA
jgi:undecaprenyl-diphosphatase